MKKEMITFIESIQTTNHDSVKVFGNLIRVNDELFPLPLVKGNSKLGETVYHASTLPTNAAYTVTDKNTGETFTEKGTCPMTCKDKDGNITCYGVHGNYNFPSVQYLLARRTAFLRKYPEIYFHCVKAQLIYEEVEKLRIHATGDFIPGEAIGFYNVLKEFPDISAWTYTKVTNDSDIDTLDSLDNMNVVKSILPWGGFNYGHNAYIAAAYYRLKRMNKSVYICRCGIDKNQHCSNCDGCSKHEYVLFIEHSTDYDAEKDYGFDKLKELIESQPKSIISSVKKVIKKLTKKTAKKTAKKA